MLILNGSNNFSARCSFYGGGSFTGLISSRIALNTFHMTGLEKVSSIPHGLRGGVALAMARSEGGMSAYLAGLGAISTATLNAAGNLTSSLTGTGNLSFANLAGGINISAVLGGNGSVNNALLPALGNLTCSISIGARPSAFDIAQAVWEELLTGHTTTNTAAKVLKDKLSRSDYIGLS